MTVEAPQIPAYRTFVVHVSQLQQLSPSFLRVTFTGPDLGDCAPNGWDQRIKLLLPLPGRGIADCPTGPDWYADWRALPDDRRNPIRTYTVRAARQEAREIDVDVVLHGATGPASAWAEQAAVGDELAIVAPNARFPGPTGGYEWHPPADASCLLVAGDETAVPAICAIVESLPEGVPARVLLEVPTSADVLPLAAPAGVEVTWLPRRVEGTTAEHGALLIEAVARAARDLPGGAGPSRAEALDDVDVDTDILWEVPDDLPRETSGPYAWLAGEAGTVKALRRHLVQETGLDRGSVAFMGYWRQGKSGD
jgi:NADPH-dependent ferric siderophore reductase